MREDRLFPPPASFREKAWIRSESEYDVLYRRSVDDPEGFWAEAARELDWIEPWQNVLEGTGPDARWFTGGRLNLSANCVDRHATGSRREKPALIWEGEPGEVRTLTYGQLHEQVSRCANVLKNIGVRKGDRVAIYMGMSPELAIALLACARIGAVHSVVFGGFAAHAIADRVNDSDCQVLITQDVSYRRGSEIKLKGMVDEALARCPGVRHTLVFQRDPAKTVAMTPGRDLWWHEAMAKASPDCPPEPMEAEDPLFILYTSGTTGKPKGLVHTTARLPGGHLPHQQDQFRSPRRRRLFLHCRHRLGHRSQLRGLRPARRTAPPSCFTRALPTSPEPDRFWKIVDRPQSDHFLYRPDRHPRLYQVGLGLGTQARPQLTCASWAP